MLIKPFRLKLDIQFFVKKKTPFACMDRQIDRQMDGWIDKDKET